MIPLGASGALSVGGYEQHADQAQLTNGGSVDAIQFRSGEEIFWQTRRVEEAVRFGARPWPMSQGSQIDLCPMTAIDIWSGVSAKRRSGLGHPDVGDLPRN